MVSTGKLSWVYRESQSVCQRGGAWAVHSLYTEGVRVCAPIEQGGPEARLLGRIPRKQEAQVS